MYPINILEYLHISIFIFCFWSPYLCMLVGCFVNGGGWWGLLWRSHGVVVAPFGWGRTWVVVVFGAVPVLKLMNTLAVVNTLNNKKKNRWQSRQSNDVMDD